MEIRLHMLHSEINVREEKDKGKQSVSILLQLQEFHSV